MLKTAYGFLYKTALINKDHPFVKNLLIDKSFKFGYVQLPKSACSTTKLNLIDRKGEEISQNDLHSNRKFWFGYGSPELEARISSSHILEIPLITTVRNPFARILSPYREKIELQLDRVDYKAGLGIKPDECPSFREFVEILLKKDLLRIDAHFQPQTKILPRAIIEDIYIASVENLQEDISTFNRLISNDRSSKFESREPHETSSSELNILNRYYKDPSTIDGVIELYHEDFCLLGYSEELQNNLSRPTKCRNTLKNTNISPYYTRKRTRADRLLRTTFGIY